MQKNPLYSINLWGVGGSLFGFLLLWLHLAQLAHICKSVVHLAHGAGYFHGYQQQLHKQLPVLNLWAS